MRLLLDRQLLLWGGSLSETFVLRGPPAIEDPPDELHFSAASVWEVAIKSGLGRSDFQVDARLLRRGLLDNDYGELAITSEHAVAAGGLPPLHRDPFDRLLVAQAMVEGTVLLTGDPLVAQYPAPVRRV